MVEVGGRGKIPTEHVAMAMELSATIEPSAKEMGEEVRLGWKTETSPKSFRVWGILSSKEKSRNGG